MTQFKRPMCSLHKTSQLCINVLHKYMNCNVKWNGEKIKNCCNLNMCDI